MAVPGKASALVRLELDLLGRRTYKAACGITVRSAFTTMTTAQLRIDFRGGISNIFVQLSHPNR